MRYLLRVNSVSLAYASAQVLRCSQSDASEYVDRLKVNGSWSLSFNELWKFVNYSRENNLMEIYAIFCSQLDSCVATFSPTVSIYVDWTLLIDEYLGGGCFDINWTLFHALTANFSICICETHILFISAGYDLHFMNSIWTNLLPNTLIVIHGKE